MRGRSRPEQWRHSSGSVSVPLFNNVAHTACNGHARSMGGKRGSVVRRPQSRCPVKGGRQKITGMSLGVIDQAPHTYFDNVAKVVTHDARDELAVWLHGDSLRAAAAAPSLARPGTRDLARPRAVATWCAPVLGTPTCSPLHPRIELSLASIRNLQASLCGC